MKRALAVVLFAALFLPSALRAQEGKSHEEQEREERREREERKGEERKDSTPKGEAQPGDDEALYAMGAILGSRAQGYGFKPGELERIKRGFADAAAGNKLKLRDPDLDEWGPRIDAMLARRHNPKVAAEKKRGEAFAAGLANEEGVTVLPSGVVLKSLSEGSGASPISSQIVRVKYEGKLIDGTVFDSSDAHGGPSEFRLDKVVRCWTEGVQQMKPGGKARLVCPSNTAYGDQGRPPQIPGGATLVFEVELLEVKR